MKNNYINFTSHPTDPKDPRVAAWKNTLQWLENEYLCLHAFFFLTKLAFPGGNGEGKGEIKNDREKKKK